MCLFDGIFAVPEGKTFSSKSFLFAWYLLSNPAMCHLAMDSVSYLCNPRIYKGCLHFEMGPMRCVIWHMRARQPALTHVFALLALICLMLSTANSITVWQKHRIAGCMSLTYWNQDKLLTFNRWHSPRHILDKPTWRSIIMGNNSTSAGTSLEGTPMFAHVTLHRTFKTLGSKCPWLQDKEAAS